MDKLTLEEVERHFTLQPNKIYAVKQGQKFISKFQVVAFTIDEKICYVDLKFSNNSEIITVEESFYLNFLDESGLELFEIKEMEVN